MTDESKEKEEIHKPGETEFKFRGDWYDLKDIITEGSHLYEIEDNGSKIKIITRAGTGYLIDFFGNIDVTFGPIQVVHDVCGESLGAVEATATDLLYPETRKGRAFGEASAKNTFGLAAKYPVAMMEKRAKARAVNDLLGIRGVYSEDEADEFKEAIREFNNKGKKGNVDHKKKGEEKKEESIDDVISEINSIIDDLGEDDEFKLKIYREIIGDGEITVSQIKAKATDNVKVLVRDRLREIKASRSE